MDLNLIDLWAKMGLPVKGVVIFLTIMAIASLTVVIDRLILLARSAGRSRAFAAAAMDLIRARDFRALLGLSSRIQGSHLASMTAVGVRTFLEQHDAGRPRQKSIELAKNALERKRESISAELNRGMSVLASTGSTAPFIGLLGTVLGIMHAFKLIGQNNSGGLGTIGGAIGESLVVTGYGLVVAIPVVLVFNWLSARIAAAEAGLGTASGELLDALDTGAAPTSLGHESEPATGTPHPMGASGESAAIN